MSIIFDKVLPLDTTNRELQRRLDISFDKITEYNRILATTDSSIIVAGSAISLSSNTAANVTSLSLSIGVWDVTGAVYFNPGGGTSTVQLQAAASTTSATLPAAGLGDGLAIVTGFSPTSVSSLAIPTTQVLVSVDSTNVYLVALAVFSVSTMAAFGNLKARRVA